MAVSRKWSSLASVPGNEINDEDIVTGLHAGTNANFKLKDFSDYSVQNVKNELDSKLNTMVENGLVDSIKNDIDSQIESMVQNGLVDNVKTDVISQLDSIVDDKIPNVVSQVTDNVRHNVYGYVDGWKSDIIADVKNDARTQLKPLVSELVEEGLIDNVKADVNSQLNSITETYVDQKMPTYVNQRIPDVVNQVTNNISSQVNTRVDQQLPSLVDAKVEDLVEAGLIDNIKNDVNTQLDTIVENYTDQKLPDYMEQQLPDIINQVTTSVEIEVESHVDQQLPALVNNKTEELVENGLIDNINFQLDSITETRVNQKVPEYVDLQMPNVMDQITNNITPRLSNIVDSKLPAIVDDKLQNFTTEERVNELIDEKTGQYITDVPIATDSTIGGVKIGEGLSINSEGLLSVNGNIGGSGNSNAESFFKHDGITMRLGSGGSFVGSWNSGSSLPGPSVNNPINVHDIYLDYTYDGHKETLYFKLPDSYTDSYYLSLFDYLSQDNWDQIIGKNIVQSKTASPTQMTQSGTYARGGNFPSVFTSNFGDFLKDDLVEVRVWLYSSASNYGNTESAPNATFNARATSNGYITAGSSSEPLPSPLQSTFSYSSDTGINLIADRSYVGYYYYVEMELKERTAEITQYNYPIKYITSLTVSIDSENKISQIEIYASGSVNQFIVDIYDPLSRKTTKELIDMALDDFLIRIEELIDAKIAAISPSNPGIVIGTIPDTATYDDNYGAWRAILQNDNFSSTFSEILNGPYTSDNNPQYIYLNPTSPTYFNITPIKRVKLKKGSNELDLSETYSKIEANDRRDNATVFFKIHAKQYSSELQYNNPFADFAGGTVIFEWE